jgi:selenocysteine lyase/cysteine desulfurase
VKFPGRDPAVLARRLRARRVHVAARKGLFRVSPHFYNDESDLERLEVELKAILSDEA